MWWGSLKRALDHRSTFFMRNSKSVPKLPFLLISLKYFFAYGKLTDNKKKKNYQSSFQGKSRCCTYYRFFFSFQATLATGWLRTKWTIQLVLELNKVEL